MPVMMPEFSERAYRHRVLLALIRCMIVVGSGVIILLFALIPDRSQDQSLLLRLTLLVAPLLFAASLVVAVGAIAPLVRGPLRVSTSGFFNPFAWKGSRRSVGWNRVTDIVGTTPRVSGREVRVLRFHLTDGDVSIVPLAALRNSPAAEEDIRSTWRETRLG